MKKVLQIKAIGSYGGAGMGEYIGREAIRQGWDSYIAYARNILPTESKFIKIGKQWNLYEHALESRLFDNSGFASRIATKQLVEKIKEISPDIVHLHNLHGYYLNVEILFNYLTLRNKPIVWTFHDCWPITGHCSHFVSVKCEKWKTHCKKCPLKKDYPKSLIFDRSSYNYDLKKRIFSAPDNMYIVTVSKWLESVVRESFLKGKDIRTIYNGIDLNVFKPSIQTKRDHCFTILGVASNWGKNKGLDDYKKLSQLLKEDERIMLVGVNDKMANILPKNIIPIKRTNSLSELAQLYSDADVLTSLSYAETFGMTIIEGYACGVPAIVYDNTAQPELATEGVGFVVEEGNVEQVYSKITQLKNMSIIEKEALSNRCRNVALSCYDKDVLFKEYVKLYEEALA